MRWWKWRMESPKKNKCVAYLDLQTMTTLWNVSHEFRNEFVFNYILPRNARQTGCEDNDVWRKIVLPVHLYATTSPRLLQFVFFTYSFTWNLFGLLIRPGSSSSYERTSCGWNRCIPCLFEIYQHAIEIKETTRIFQFGFIGFTFNFLACILFIKVQ